MIRLLRLVLLLFLIAPGILPGVTSMPASAGNAESLARDTLLAAEHGTTLPVEAHPEEASHGQEPFNAGEYVVSHVADAYEWHFATIGKTHISLPLPVLLYSRKSGFHAFFPPVSSMAMRHGKDLPLPVKARTKGRSSR